MSTRENIRLIARAPYIVDYGKIMELCFLISVGTLL